jgi:hypothetical protein
MVLCDLPRVNARCQWIDDARAEAHAVQEGMRFTTLLPLLLLFSACGDDGGGGGGGTPDAPSNVPAMVTISGTTAEKSTSTTMLSGVMIAAYRNSDPNTPVVMTTSDAQGNYTLSIPTNGMALDGYVKATYTGLIDTYLYPPRALVADFSGASIYMVSTSTRDLLSGTLCGALQDNAKGVVAVLVVDAAMTPIAGATVSSSPAAAKYCYNSGGFPNKTATMTDTDGIAYMINLPAGDVTVMAAKSGLNFPSHKVNARAGTLTTTPIQQE